MTLVTVEFIEDFANKTKGDVFKCDSMLASQLVNIDNVAIYTDKLEAKQVQVVELIDTIIANEIATVVEPTLFESNITKVVVKTAKIK